MKPEDVPQELVNAVQRMDSAYGRSDRHLGPWRRVPDTQVRRLLAAAHDEIERQVRARLAELVAAPPAMTNAELSELAALEYDSFHEQCGPVWRRYFERVARGEA